MAELAIQTIAWRAEFRSLFGQWRHLHAERFRGGPITPITVGCYPIRLGLQPKTSLPAQSPVRYSARKWHEAVPSWSVPTRTNRPALSNLLDRHAIPEEPISSGNCRVDDRVVILGDENWLVHAIAFVAELNI